MKNRNTDRWRGADHERAAPASEADEVPSLEDLYGLEPVFEPGAGNTGGDSAGSLRLQSVQCPYCGEPFETVLDLSSGTSRYIEDCQVCCRPIEFRLDIDADGALAALEVYRSD